MMSWILAVGGLTGHAMYSSGHGIGWVLALVMQAFWFGYGLSSKDRRGFCVMSVAYGILNANAVFGLWSEPQFTGWW